MHQKRLHLLKYTNSLTISTRNAAAKCKLHCSLNKTGLKLCFSPCYIFLAYQRTEHGFRWLGFGISLRCFLSLVAVSLCLVYEWCLSVYLHGNIRKISDFSILMQHGFLYWTRFSVIEQECNC